MNQQGIEETTLLTILLVTLIIIIYLTWMVRYKAKAKERLLIIEKDYDLNKFLEKKESSFPWIKVGIVFTSGCIGFLIGSIIEVFSLTTASVDASELERFANSSPKKKLIGDGTLTLLLMYIFAGIAMIFSKKITKDK